MLFGFFFNLLLKNQHVDLFGHYKFSHHLIQGCLILVDSSEVTDHNCPHAMAQRFFFFLLLFEFSLWKIVFCATSKAQGKYKVLHTAKKKCSHWAPQIHSSRHTNDKTHIFSVNIFRFFTEMRPAEFVAEEIGIMGLGVAINKKLGLTRKRKSHSAW